MFPFSFISGVDTQALASYNSLIAAGYTVPQGITGIDNAFKAIKNIYGTSDITNAVSYFADPSLAYQSGAGSGTTLGQAIRTLPNLVDNTRTTDAVQTTAASQPLLLVHEGANYWQGVGVASNFVSTPSVGVNQITGDIEITCDIRFENLGTTYFLCSKIAGPSNFAYEFTRDSSNRLVFSFSTTGSNQIDVQSTVVQPFGIGVRGFIRVNRNAANGNVVFSTSTDGITYNQLGSVVTSTAGAIFAGTRTLGIGASSAGSGAILGKIYRVTISNSIGGAPVVDFNPSQYNASVSQTQWTSSTGEIWSINTDTAATGYKGVLVDRTIMQADGIDDKVSNATNIISFTSAFGMYCSVRSFPMTFVQYPTIFGQGIDSAAGNQRNVMLVAKKFNESTPRIATDIYGTSGVQTPTDSTLNLNFYTSLRVSNWSTHRTNGLTKINKNNNSLAVTSYGGTDPATPLNTSGFALFSLAANPSSGSYMNGIISTFILSKAYDSDSINSAMYNYIRSINNNAF